MIYHKISMYAKFCFIDNYYFVLFMFQMVIVCKKITSRLTMEVEVSSYFFYLHGLTIYLFTV